MDDELYYFLRNYGFSKEELDNIEDYNEEVFFATVSDVKIPLRFLERKGFDKNDILRMINQCPLLLTERKNRLDALHKIWVEKFSFSKSDLLDFSHVCIYIYDLAPAMVRSHIKRLEKEGKNIAEIKAFVFENPEQLEHIANEVVSHGETESE